MGTVAEKTSGGDYILHSRPVAVGIHAEQFSLPGVELLHHSPHIVVGHIDIQVLDRLAKLPVDLLHDDLRRGQRQLVALPAHILHKNGQMHFSPARNNEAVGGVSIPHTQGHIPHQLVVQPFTQMS